MWETYELNGQQVMVWLPDAADLPAALLELAYQAAEEPSGPGFEVWTPTGLKVREYLAKRLDERVKTGV